MPLAGFSASEGKLSLVGVLVAGTLGTLAGALFWYAVAHRLGEARLRRWAGRHGRWITLSENDIARSNTRSAATIAGLSPLRMSCPACVR